MLWQMNALPSMPSRRHVYHWTGVGHLQQSLLSQPSAPPGADAVGSSVNLMLGTDPVLHGSSDVAGHWLLSVSLPVCLSSAALGAAAGVFIQQQPEFLANNT